MPAPRVVYRAPYYGRPGAWVAPAPYGYRHWEHRHDDWRDGYRPGTRAGYGF
jgi:hypothetical protein